MPDGHRLLLDAGSGARNFARTIVPMPEPDIGTRTLPVLLTHRHHDHVSGIALLATAIAHSYRLRVACGGVSVDELQPLIAQQISAPLFPDIDGLAARVNVAAFDDDDLYIVSANCRVRALTANHPGGASVLVVEDSQGAVLAYAPDNELAYADDDPALGVWRRALADTLRGIPLLLHDATFLSHELASHRGWGHSSAEEATRFAMQCGAESLLLMHHDPDRDDDAIDAAVAMCRALVAKHGSRLRVAAAADGLAFDIEYSQADRVGA